VQKGVEHIWLAIIRAPAPPTPTTPTAPAGAKRLVPSVAVAAKARAPPPIIPRDPTMIK